MYSSGKTFELGVVMGVIVLVDVMIVVLILGAAEGIVISVVESAIVLLRLSWASCNITT